MKSALKDLRDGCIDGDAVVLWVEGKDCDDILRRGLVLLRRDDGGWRYMEADLDSVDE